MVCTAGGSTQEVEELIRFSETPKKLELLYASKIYFTFLSSKVLNNSTPRERSIMDLVCKSDLGEGLSEVRGEPWMSGTERPAPTHLGTSRKPRRSAVETYADSRYSQYLSPKQIS